MTRTDEQLIADYQTGDKGAADLLIQRYQGLVCARARQFGFVVGTEVSDLQQEGNIGLWDAIGTFERKKGTFASLAARCVLRKVLSAVRAASTQKNRPINEGVPLEDDLFLAEAQNPEEIYLAAEYVSERKKAIMETLASKEKKVFALYLEGLSQAEIANKLGYTEKMVSNAVQRIKRKAALLRR